MRIPGLRRIAVVSLVLFAYPVAAQEAESVTVTGVVVDGETGDPVPGVLVSVEAFDWGVLSDDDGRFSLPDVPPGPTTLAFEQLGYAELLLTERVRDGMGALRVELAPKPVVLEGIRVMANRFESRRNATPTSVRAYGREQLRFAPLDVLDFLRTRGMLFVTPCPIGWSSLHCLRHRGRVVEPRVYVDEFPVLAGLDMLEALPSHMIYLVEVYRNGRHIRIYTNQYMERVGRTRPAPIPIW